MDPGLEDQPQRSVLQVPKKVELPAEEDRYPKVRTWSGKGWGFDYGVVITGLTVSKLWFV